MRPHGNAHVAATGIVITIVKDSDRARHVRAFLCALSAGEI